MEMPTEPSKWIHYLYFDHEKGLSTGAVPSAFIRQGPFSENKPLREYQYFYLYES